MTEWCLVPVRELCTDIVDCINKTAPTVDYATPWKMLRTTNVRGGWVDTGNVKYVERDVFERWNRRIQPIQGDVILTREAPLGDVGILRSSDQVFLGQRLVMYRVDPDRCDNRFLAYAMLGPEVQAELRRLGSGATVEHLRVADCERFPVRCPPLPTQKRIGAILGSIDDLIENNRRRIEVLEQMAQDIYREWFVHFRFPGHENATVFDSAVGRIPSDWQIEPASVALLVNPRHKLDQAAAHPFITMSDLSERSMVCFPSDRKPGGSGTKFRNGDTLFARITPCLENGKTGFVRSLDEGEIGRGSTEFTVLRGRHVGPTFTYFLARDEHFRSNAISSMSGASGRQRVRNECFDTFLLAVPPKSLAADYERLAEPPVAMAFTLARENQALGRLRNLLLPKLVTGVIDVSGSELD